MIFLLAWFTGAIRPVCANELVIGRILIDRKNVFETGSKSDRQFPYSWGNKLHIVTKKGFIRNELLFKEGDPFDITRIRESERLLRSRPVFRYVTMTPQEPVNGTVDVLIETEDVWTTSVQLAYGTAGGKNFYTLGFLEHNFLGHGKSVGGFVRKDIDRYLRGMTYADPRFLGARLDFFLGYGRDEKGREWEGRLEKPFYSVLVPHSEGISTLIREDEDRLFEGGDESAKFLHKFSEARFFTAYALNPSHDRVRRVTLAHERRKDEFSDVRSRQTLELPKVREVNPLLLGFYFQNYEFHKVRGVMTFDRDEDINLGWEWSIEGGPILKDLNSTREGGAARIRVKKTRHPEESQAWFNHMDVTGRVEGGIIHNGILKLQSHFFLMNRLNKNTASLRGEIIFSKNLDPERQYLLGGENGLRGYSVRQFSGEKKILAALENRRVIIYDWLHLASFGWAVFADAGAVWKQHNALQSRDIKSDVGAGLRFAPSRSVDPGLIRIDVAYALQDNNRRSRFVLNIGADLSFGERRPRKFDQ